MVSEREALVDIIWQTTKVLSPVNEAIADAILTSGILTTSADMEARTRALVDEWEEQAREAQAAFAEMGYDDAPAISKTLNGHAQDLRALLDAAPAGGAEDV